MVSEQFDSGNNISKIVMDEALQRLQQGVRRMRPLVVEQQPERDMRFQRPAMVVQERCSRFSDLEQMEKRWIQKKARLEMLKECKRMIDRWDEDDAAKQSLEEETIADRDKYIQSVVVDVERNQLIKPEEVECNQLIKPQVKDGVSTQSIEMLLLVSNPTKDVMMCDKEVEEEDPLASMADLSTEQNENLRKKKKRWKKLVTKKLWKRDLCYEEEDLIGFGLMHEEGHPREDINNGNVNSNSYVYHVFDQMPGRGKRVKKKRKKKRMKIECMIKGIKKELRFRELLVNQKRVLQELAKWKNLKFKHKACKRRKTREMFSAVITRRRARLRLKYVVHGKLLSCVSKLGKRIENESSACQVINKLLERMKYKFKQKLYQRMRVSVMRQRTRVGTAKTSEGAELRYTHMGHRKLLSLVTSVEKRLMMNCKKKKKVTETLSGKQFALIWHLYLEPAMIRKKNRKRCKRSHCKEACLCCVKLSLLQSQVKQNEELFPIKLETRDKLKQGCVRLVFLVMVGTQERQTDRVYWVAVIGGAWDPGGIWIEDTVEIYMSTGGEVTAGKEQLIGLNICLRRKKEGNELKANLITFFREWKKRKKSNPDGKYMLFLCLSVGSECGHNTAPAKPMTKPLQSESTVKCELKKNTHEAVIITIHLFKKVSLLGATRKRKDKDLGWDDFNGDTKCLVISLMARKGLSSLGSVLSGKRKNHGRKDGRVANITVKRSIQCAAESEKERVYKIRNKRRMVKKHGTPLAPEMGVGRRDYYQYEVQKLNAGASMWRELNITGLLVRTHAGPPEKWASKLVVFTGLGAIQFTETIAADADHEQLQVLYLQHTELDGGELGGFNNRLKTKVNTRELLGGKERGISMVCLLKILLRAEVSKKRKMFQNFFLIPMLDRRGINRNKELMSQNGMVIKALILLELDVAKLQNMLRQEEELSREMRLYLKLLEGDDANLEEAMEWVKAYYTQDWSQFKALDCYCKLQNTIYRAIPIVQAWDFQDDECSWYWRVATISCHLAPTLRTRLNSKGGVMIRVGIG